MIQLVTDRPGADGFLKSPGWRAAHALMEGTTIASNIICPSVWRRETACHDLIRGSPHGQTSYFVYSFIRDMTSFSITHNNASVADKESEMKYPCSYSTGA